MKKYLIGSGRVVTNQGVRPLALLIDGGRIVGHYELSSMPNGVQVIDCGNSVLMAGGVDTHVHLNEPGRETWEGFVTGTRAAARGGFTTLVDMPLNSTPALTGALQLQQKVDAARGKLSVDVGFHGGLVPQNAASLDALLSSGILGIKAFMVHSGVPDFEGVNERHLRLAMPQIAASGLTLLVHAELDLPNPFVPSNPRSYSQYVRTRPAAMEVEAIKLLIRLCREYRTKLHIVHLATAEGVQLLADAKAEGLPITVETCPHYLHFAEEDIPDGQPIYKCAPPIRDLKNRDALRAALGSGVIDFVVSDHSPSDPAGKCLDTGDLMSAWGGISGLQYGLSVVWTMARERGYSIEQLARWMSSGPAALVGLTGTKGSLDVGCDADIVEWDPDASFVVSEADNLHRHRITPYTGETLSGVVRSTYLRGVRIYDGQAVSDDMLGVPILRT